LNLKAAWAATISAPVAGTAEFSEEFIKTVLDATGPIASDRMALEVPFKDHGEQ
jgi:hypothetical protein